MKHQTCANKTKLIHTEWSDSYMHPLKSEGLLQIKDPQIVLTVIIVLQSINLMISNLKAK